MLRPITRLRSSTLPICWFVSLALGCDKPEPARRSPSTAGQAASTSGASTPSGLPPLPKPPASFGRVKAPPNNPTTAAKVQLGRHLFFDPTLSVDGSRSCYSCHQNEDGTGGHEPLAIGAKNASLTRHAPGLWNVGYLPKVYWDGRADSLEAQAKEAWAGAIMGVGEEQLFAKAEAIGDRPEYTPQFKAAFPGLGATPDTVVQAISAYERTLFCGDTAVDRHLAGDATALDEKQKAGLELFIGKAACHGCHTPPFFSDAYLSEDGSYHNVGIGLTGKDPKDVDVGRQKISNNPSDWGAFKTPSLRNVTRSAPYLHDGSKTRLEDVVRFMAGGGAPNPGIDPKMVDKKLNDDEIAQIIAFLGALTCPGELEPPKPL
jgi:cytochrome c peroxidase